MWEGQEIFNLVIGTMMAIIGFLVGCIYNNFSNRLTKVEDRQSTADILVAGKYITREEVLNFNQLIFNKLDVIQGDIRSCMLDRHHHQRENDKP